MKKTILAFVVGVVLGCVPMAGYCWQLAWDAELVRLEMEDDLQLWKAIAKDASIKAGICRPDDPIPEGSYTVRTTHTYTSGWFDWMMPTRENFYGR